MAVRRMSGVKSGIDFGLTLTKPIRISILSTLLVLGGRTFNANAQTVTILYSFVSSPNDGYYPYAGLVQGSDGNFYGTTERGGTSTNCFGGCGTIFRISPSGGYTNLHSFVGSPMEGSFPNAGLVQGSDGNFYGTTLEGGMTTNLCFNGCGTIFKMSPNGSFTNLYSFTHIDGNRPAAGLVQGSEGSFYGTTLYGGTSTNCSFTGCGTIFKISPNGNFTNLYSFNGSDGIAGAGLVEGSDGNFYGTTTEGGTTNRNALGYFGYGTVFRISPSGSYTNLYVFSGGDGANPTFSGLVQGSDGNFYGTTQRGGVSTNCGSFGCGTVFKISPKGSFTNLYLFSGTDAAVPNAGLVQGSDGEFYGTTLNGVTNYYEGTIFRINSSGSLTFLHYFGSIPNDGAYPYPGLIQGSDGNFYGTTTFGGINNSGTVYRLSIPLNPPANQICQSQLSVHPTSSSTSPPSPGRPTNCNSVPR